MPTVRSMTVVVGGYAISTVAGARLFILLFLFGISALFFAGTLTIR